MADFVDELSNWYVRRSRERFWGKGMAGDKVAAFATLYHMLGATHDPPDRAVHAVHGGEHVPQPGLLRRSDRADFCPVPRDFPVCDEKYIDTELEQHMRDLLEVVVLGRSCRNESGLKVRQPLSRMIVSGATLPQDLCALAEDELNVKDAVFTDDASEFMTYQLKPQMRTLGKKYGKLLQGDRRKARHAGRQRGRRGL